MRLSFSQGKRQANERKRIIQVVQQHAQAAAVHAIRPVLMGELEAEGTATGGRGKGEPRQGHSAGRSRDWHCGCGGGSDAH